MSTHCLIGVKIKAVDKSEFYFSVFCQCDGYPEGVGRTLLRCYNSREKALDIIGMGHLESLSDTLELQEEKEGLRDALERIGKGISYTRRLKAQPCGVFVAESEEAFLKSSPYLLTDYYYVFDTEKDLWYVLRGNEKTCLSEWFAKGENV